jgi:4-amino-4-deoxychorismate lyase
MLRAHSMRHNCVLHGACRGLTAATAAANIKTLSAEEVVAAAAARRADTTNSHLVAMYSSYHGGIITDPGLMSLPVDDHMANRGHGMFDTGGFADGRFYRLEAHVERILRNAGRANIPHSFTKEGLIEIIVETVRSTGLKDGSVRYFLTAGHGGFSWTPDECVEAGFYCIVIDGSAATGTAVPQVKDLTLQKEFTAQTRFLRPQFLAQTKSNNYLLNVMIAMESKAKGGAGYGIWVDEDDLVIEGAVCSVVFITNELELITPRTDFERTALDGKTVERVLAIGERMVTEGKLKSVQQRDVKATEVKGSLREMIMVGGDTHFTPIGEWDGVPVGSGMGGEVGDVCKEIYQRVLDEMLQDQNDKLLHIDIYETVSATAN